MPNEVAAAKRMIEKIQNHHDSQAPKHQGPTKMGMHNKVKVSLCMIMSLLSIREIRPGMYHCMPLCFKLASWPRLFFNGAGALPGASGRQFDGRRDRVNGNT